MVEQNEVAVEEAPAVPEVAATEEASLADETSAVEETAVAPTIEEVSAAEEVPAVEAAPVEDVSVEEEAEVEVPVVSIDTVQDEPEPESVEVAESVAISRSPSPSPSVQEHPKSPWTPSYSVTTQGPGANAEEEKEIEQLEQLPPVVQEEAVPTPQVEVTAEVRCLVRPLYTHFAHVFYSLPRRPLRLLPLLIASLPSRHRGFRPTLSARRVLAPFTRPMWRLSRSLRRHRRQSSLRRPSLLPSLSRPRMLLKLLL